MIKGILIGNPSELKGIEEKLKMEQLGEFDITRQSNLFLSLLTNGYNLGFSPENRVYAEIERKASYFGANLVIITSTIKDSDMSFGARGLFYKI